MTFARAANIIARAWLTFQTAYLLPVRAEPRDLYGRVTLAPFMHLLARAPDQARNFGNRRLSGHDQRNGNLPMLRPSSPAIAGRAESSKRIGKIRLTTVIARSCGDSCHAAISLQLVLFRDKCHGIRLHRIGLCRAANASKPIDERRDASCVRGVRYFRAYRRARHKGRCKMTGRLFKFHCSKRRRASVGSSLLLFDVRSQLSFAVSLFSLLLIRFAHTALSHSDLLAPFGRLPFSSGLYLRCRLVPGRN